MSGKTTILITAALAATLHLSVSADTVELANGDTLTGTVISQQDGKIVIEHAQLGRIELPADRVKAVNIDAQPAPPPPAEAAAPPPPAPQPAAPDLPAPAPELDKEKVQEEAAKAAEQETPDLWDTFTKEWNTKLTLGFTGTSGNADRQNYHAKLDTTHEHDDDRWTINAGWFYAVSNNVRSQNEFNTRITRDWLQKDRPWFFFIRGEHTYNQFRAWENRTSGFGGAGYTFVDDKEFHVNARLGFGGTYDFGQINEFTPEALFGGSVAKWKINDRQTLTGETTYYPSLEDDSDFRIQTKLEWLYKLDLAKGLSLKIGMENEYESLTPGDKANNDLKYYGALVLSF